VNLWTVKEVRRPSSADQITEWRDGYAWLAGGTWLFSEPQIHTHTLIDLEDLKWKSLAASTSGLDLAATCKIVEIYNFKPPAEWLAGPLLRECCEAFLASFKIWNASTVGGNLCMSLPAGPMISLTAALEATLTLWPRDGEPRKVRVADFVTGNNKNVLAPGELLRSIHIPAESLAKHVAFRRSSLTHLGRSNVLLIGTRSTVDGSLVLTVTAATVKPFQVKFDTYPSATQMRHAIDALIPDSDYHNDVHGTPHYRRHLTYYYAEQIRLELEAKAPRA
jgi:CO/xanthine dehydrogenase FAD-binding subunit